MAITLKSLIALAKPKHSVPRLRSIVFDGKSAMCAAPMVWVAGVPCPQAHITEPVVVPVDAILAHMAKSRHLVVMPDHLSNGQGMVTPFHKGEVNYDMVLDMLPPLPDTEAVVFDLELDALDRVLVATGVHDIRYYLNGVLFDLSNGALVGTDGHRLHMYRNQVPVVYPMAQEDGSCREGGAVQLILHRDPLKWLVHSAGQFSKVTIFNPLCEKVDDKPTLPGVLMQADDAFVWVKKPVEGRYVDYARVIPAVLPRPVWMELNPVQLADASVAMRKVLNATVGTKKGSPVFGVLVDFGKGVFSGGVDFPEVGELPFTVSFGTDDESIDLAALSDTLWMGMNPEYLQDLADCVTPAAQWRLDHVAMMNQALLVMDGDFSGLVMPCQTGGPVKAARPEPVAELDAVAKVLGSIREQVADFEPVAELDVQDDPEETPPEPCPAAVATIAAQLVTQAQESAKKAPKKARKVANPELVA